MNNKRKTSNQLVGKLGEDLACRYLFNSGFSIIERNYLKKCGEIDIVATRKGIIHFIEVKAIRSSWNNVIHETTGSNSSKGYSYRPEENLHGAKLKRIVKTIHVYLVEKQIPEDAVWAIDLVTVLIDTKRRISRMSFIKDIAM